MAYVYSEGVQGAGLYSAADGPEQTRLTSWGFSIDGHPFMFLNLGSSGTLVFDLSTRQWCSWSLEGNVGIALEDGQSFDEFYLMGDPVTNEIYTFDPTEVDDSAGGFTTVATGGVPLRRRITQRCFAVYAVGNRTDEDGRTVTLYTSDDNGLTWRYHGAVTGDGDNPEIAWRSLGLISTPGRIFTVYDEGVFQSIDGLDMTAGPNE